MDNFLIGNTPAINLGVTFLEGVYQQLLSMPKLKPGITNDWPDESGTDRDILTLNYESRVLNLPVMLEGTSAANLLIRFDAFKSLLTSGYFILKCQRLNRTYTLLYSEASNLEWYDDYVTFTMTVIDDFPTDLTPYA